jgi:uncharacterized protein YbjT (DUF2867 family)
MARNDHIGTLDCGDCRRYRTIFDICEDLVIVIFGASSDIGRRLSARLRAHGHADGQNIRLVSRNPAAFGSDVPVVKGEIANVAELAADASVVVSCAHARHTAQLLSGAPPTVDRFVLTGSAWRYSRIPNVRADAVRDAERTFLESGRRGAMLHPTMIYGGSQERNLQRLVHAARHLPFLPAPGGGRNLVQPIFVDDVAACLAAAVRKTWSSATIIPIAGPKPMMWREMVHLCLKAVQTDRRIVAAPIFSVGAIAVACRRLGIALPISLDEIDRFGEDVNIPTDRMIDELGIMPRHFEAGIAEAAAGWRSSR